MLRRRRRLAGWRWDGRAAGVRVRCAAGGGGGVGVGRVATLPLGGVRLQATVGGQHFGQLLVVVLHALQSGRCGGGTVLVMVLLVLVLVLMLVQLLLLMMVRRMVRMRFHRGAQLAEVKHLHGDGAFFCG